LRQPLVGVCADRPRARARGRIPAARGQGCARARDRTGALARAPALRERGMNPLAALETVVVLTGLQRAFELVHSRRNLRTLSSASRAADSRANWIALVALQALWLAGCGLEPVVRGGLAGRRWLVAGGPLFVAGAVLRAWCIVTLGPRWNARARVDPALGVIASGPYRWLRHPNYLGVLLECVGLPLAGGAWATLGLLAP